MDDRMSRGAPRRSSASPAILTETETTPRVWFAMCKEPAVPATIVVREGHTTRPARRGAPAEAGATVARTTASVMSFPRTVSAEPPCMSPSPCTARPARSAAPS